MTTVGIIANPAAGKDLRRLVAHAAPVADGTKVGVVRRAVLGAVAAGAERILLSNDPRGLGARAADGLEVAASVEIVDEPFSGDRSDTVAAAHRFYKADVAAVIVLGGDGTCRDVATAWLDAPLIALSTGTNNVFPHPTEPTLAGLAAGALASGALDVGEVADRTNAIHVRVGDTEEVALVDVALLAGRVVGARAVWEAESIRELVVAIAEPATIGLASVAGLLETSRRSEPGGVHVRTGGDRVVRAPIAPGWVVPVRVADHRRLDPGEPVDLRGPGVVSLDGERDLVLGDDDVARCTVEHDGPWLVDVDRAMAAAARKGLLDGR